MNPELEHQLRVAAIQHHLDRIKERELWGSQRVLENEVMLLLEICDGSSLKLSNALKEITGEWANPGLFTRIRQGGDSPTVRRILRIPKSKKRTTINIVTTPEYKKTYVERAEDKGWTQIEYFYYLGLCDPSRPGGIYDQIVGSIRILRERKAYAKSANLKEATLIFQAQIDILKQVLEMIKSCVDIE